MIQTPIGNLSFGTQTSQMKHGRYGSPFRKNTALHLMIDNSISLNKHQSYCYSGSTAEQSATVLGIAHLNCFHVAKLSAPTRKRPSWSQTTHQVKMVLNSRVKMIKQASHCHAVDPQPPPISTLRAFHQGKLPVEVQREVKDTFCLLR